MQNIDVCKYCGTAYLKKHYNEKYCSNECRKLAKKELDKGYKKRKTRIVKCKYCGEKFLQEHANEKYCSTNCKESAKLEQNANAANRYYRKYRWRGGSRTFGVGTGYLSGHACSDESEEKVKIKNEFRRLNLKVL